MKIKGSLEKISVQANAFWIGMWKTSIICWGQQWNYHLIKPKENLMVSDKTSGLLKGKVLHRSRKQGHQREEAATRLFHLMTVCQVRHRSLFTGHFPVNCRNPGLNHLCQHTLPYKNFQHDTDNSEKHDMCSDNFVLSFGLWIHQDISC